MGTPRTLAPTKGDSLMDDRYCPGTWNSDRPFCTAWLPDGWPYHGCGLAPGHRDSCLCKCGRAEYGRSEFSTKDARKRRHYKVVANETTRKRPVPLDLEGQGALEP